MKRLIVPSLLLLPLTTATADVYQFELTGSYSDTDWVLDQETWNVGGTFYFQPVDDSVGPLGEAAFLNKASSIDVAYSNLEIDVPGFGDLDGDFFAVGGRYVDPGSNLIFKASYGSGDVDDIDIDLFEIGAGIYLDEISSLEFTYRKEEYDFDFMGVQLLGDVDSYELDYRRVTPVTGGDFFTVEAGIGYSDQDNGDDATTLQLGGEYFFTRQASVGASIGFVSGDDDDAMLYSVGGEVFLSNAFAVRASFDVIDYDDFDESETFTLGVRGRF